MVAALLLALALLLGHNEPEPQGLRFNKDIILDTTQVRDLRNQPRTTAHLYAPDGTCIAGDDICAGA